MSNRKVSSFTVRFFWPLMLCLGLGLGLMALGAAIAVGWSAVCWKLALVVVLQWCTSPLSGHMLAQLEYRTDAALPAHLELPQETEEGGVRV